MDFFTLVRKAKEAGGGPVEKILGEGDSSSEVLEKKVPRRRMKKNDSVSGTADVPDSSDTPAEGGQSEGLQGAGDSTVEGEGDDEPLVGLKSRKRKSIKTSDPAVSKKTRADEESVLKATDIVASKDPALDEVLHQPFLSKDIIPEESGDQLEDDIIDRRGFSPDLPIEAEGDVQVDIEAHGQTPTAEGAGSGAGDEGRLIDVRKKAPSKMKGILVIGEGRMDAPVGDAEHPYLEALKSVSSSNLRKQLEKVRKEEEQALMERNLAEV
ncbi:hypothetical protein Dimus_038852 [Dionaea muscipula]